MTTSLFRLGASSRASLRPLRKNSPAGQDSFAAAAGSMVVCGQALRAARTVRAKTSSPSASARGITASVSLKTKVLWRGKMPIAVRPAARLCGHWLVLSYLMPCFPLVRS